MIAEHKGEVPLLVYILPFITGIIAGLYLDLPVNLLLTAAVFFSCLFVGLNTLYGRLKLYLHPWTGGLLIHIILFVTGIIAVKQHDDHSKSTYFGRQQAELAVVKINSEPTLKGKYLHCTAEVIETVNKQHKSATTGKLLLTIMADSTHRLQYGDVLLVPANYKPVDPPFNPGAFNYKAYLARQNIYQQSFLFPGQYKVVAHNQGNRLIAVSLRLRQHFVQKFKANIKDTSAAAVASTLILGYKADLSQDILQAYSKTGTIHVLSVSGAHVAIVYVFISFLLSFMNGRRAGQWLKAVLAVLLIWAYAMLTGFSPAVCRSALMISMVILGNTSRRYNNTANLLALSAFVLLLYDPMLLADVGFQLSYLAVLGLIMLQPVINKWIDFKYKWANKLWYYISASVAAQVITFPLSAFYFHQFPVYFLVSNLFIIIPSELILFTGLIAMLLPKIPYLSAGVFWLLEKTIIVMNKGLTLIEQQPFSAVNQIWFTAAECILLFTAIITLFYFLYNRRSLYLKVCLFATFILTCSVSYGKIKAHSTNSILFYSLSKHAGILFKNGNQGVLMTDLASTDPNYRYSVQPAIDSSRIADLKIISPDADITTPFFRKQGPLIQWGDQRVIILSKNIRETDLPQMIRVDYLYITGNPPIDISFIMRNFLFDRLVIDGANSPQRTKKLVTEAAALKLKFTVLRRNNSLLAVSK